jgi:hypothetical protein
VCLCVYLVWQKDGRNIKDQIRNDGKHFPHFTYYYSGAKKKKFLQTKSITSPYLAYPVSLIIEKQQIPSESSSECRDEKCIEE